MTARFRPSGEHDTVLLADGQVVAVFTDPGSCRDVAARLNATRVQELPAVAAADQRREDLAAEFRRQMKPLQRLVDQFRGQRERAIGRAEQYRREAAALERTDANVGRHRRLLTRAGAIYEVFEMRPPLIEGVDPDPLDRISETTKEG